MHLGRRGFLAGALGAGFALAARPILAQAIHTSMDGLDGGDVRLGDIPAYYAVPRHGGRRPVVLVVAEIFGLHEHIRDLCRRLAKAGYFAVANEPYFRIGELWKLSDIKQVIAGANQLTDVQAFADLDTVVAWADGHARAEAARLGITGFCRGGRTVWMYVAHSARPKAGVAWYGPLRATPPAMPHTPMDVAAGLHAPVLGLYGAEDQGIPLELVEKMRVALRAAGKDRECELHVYEGAGHAFNADYRPSYRKDAAEDGWRRMLAWFARNGV